MDLWKEALKSALTYLIAIALGAVVTALQSRKRLEDFEKNVIKPLRDDVTALKTTYVTRAELERDMERLRSDMKEWVNLLREDIRNLAKELRERNPH